MPHPGAMLLNFVWLYFIPTELLYIRITKFLLPDEIHWIFNVIDSHLGLIAKKCVSNSAALVFISTYPFKETWTFRS